ncbi:hypothetical protein CH275_04790 [Rhodococcus sp. 06-235-1A]|uniref:DUF6297 family protein n=1 Tax=Rhodococcus sp. 06-235-1A TaxID=2022508 RepID=UPI000B9B5EEB|nr:DUF6297 family protein [Rhodococcus sp. 06-235-1A]OZD08473.1 hypothetical protein CH275_04790 [Rhodococcus sp. 06-235-1A]
MPTDIGTVLAVWGLPAFVATGLLWHVLGRIDPGTFGSGESVAGLVRSVDSLFAVGLAIAAFGLLMVAVRALGPVVVNSAERFWIHSTPLDRSAVLAPRYWASTACGSALGVLIARGSTLVGPAAHSWWWFGGMGAAIGASVVGCGVCAQTSRLGDRWYRNFSVGLVCVAVLGSSLSVLYAPVLPASSVVWAAAFAVVSGIAIVSVGRRRVRRLNRAALERGSGLVTSLSVATTTMDSSFVSSEMDVRTWRRVGLVRSRSFSGSRWRMFVDADARRVLRDRSAVSTLVAVIIVVYLCTAVFTLPLRPLALLLACCVVGSAFGRGLRDINSSSAFRAAFGGSDRSLRSAHLVVPAAGVFAVFAACAPVVFGASLWAVLPIPFVALAALYRSASRPPLEYGGLILETPMGQVPVDMLRQMLRGPLVVFAYAAVQIAVGVG